MYSVLCVNNDDQLARLNSEVFFVVISLSSTAYMHRLI